MDKSTPKPTNNGGFQPRTTSKFLWVSLVVALAVLIGGGAYAMWPRQSKSPEATATPTNTPSNTSTSTPNTSKDDTAATNVTWLQTANGYMPSTTPPTCANPIVSVFPASLGDVTAILYPGQTRGGNYKPHGGFRFDKLTSNTTTVKAPFDGTIIDGSRYLADNTAGDVQYTFDVMNDCGMMFRVGHLLTLSDDLAAIAKNFPTPQRNDSRTTRVEPGVRIKAGTVMATAVGTSSDANVFFDFGLYDWNQPNSISKDATWAANSAHNNDLAKHALCWFDQLSASDEATVRGLPAGDPTSGKSSDYCK